MRLIVDIQKELKSHTLQIQFETKTQTTGILGASGCGKSMLLKCIAGVETADKGQIVLNDQVLFDAEKKINLSPQQRKIGLLFQQYALFPHLSVVENLTCVTKDLQLVTQLLASFHLTKVQQQYPSQLSGGQRQRVAFARMLAAQPAYLLLDEPFSALDAPLKEELQIELQQRLSNLKQHALIVSHSLDELYKLCQSLVIITKNQTLFGATNQLFNQPQTIEAAKLTGCKNIWPVKRIDAHRVQVIGWQPIKSKCITYKHCQHLLNKVLGFNTNKPKFGGKAAIDSIRKLLLSYPFHLQQLCHYVYKIEKDYVKRLTYDCIFIYNRFMKGYSCKRNNRYYIGSEGV